MLITRLSGLINMADTAHTHDELDDEKPSTIKEGFQRWLLVAGVLVTLLFGYLFIILSDREKEKAAEDTEVVTVPTQVQEGALGSQSSAIEKFKAEIENTDRTTAPVGEKVKDAPINPAFAPRKTASLETSAQTNTRLANSQKAAEPVQQSAYEKFLEAEQMRAYKSIAAKDSIGDDAEFYNDNNASKKPASSGEMTVPRESLEQKQSRIRSQIDAITQYREAIERGDIDPTAPPPPGLFSAGATR